MGSFEVEAAGSDLDSGPEYDLIVHCFVRGITDGLRYRLHGSDDDGRHDLQWMKSDRVKPFSFIWCCEQIGLDPEVVRERLLNNPEQSYRALRHGNRSRGGRKAQG